MTNMVEGNISNQYPLTKIRNYYRMGDGIMDGYPIIQDQTSPNLAHIPTTNLFLNSEDFLIKNLNKKYKGEVILFHGSEDLTVPHNYNDQFYKSKKFPKLINITIKIIHNF